MVQKPLLLFGTSVFITDKDGLFSVLSVKMPIMVHSVKENDKEETNFSTESERYMLKCLNVFMSMSLYVCLCAVYVVVCVHVFAMVIIYLCANASFCCDFDCWFPSFFSPSFFLGFVSKSPLLLALNLCSCSCRLPNGLSHLFTSSFC